MLDHLRQVAERVEATPKREPSLIDQPVRPYRIDRRLSPDQITELVTAYQSGTSTPKLCQQYGLSKWSVLKILNDHGVPMRQPRHLTEAQIDQAVGQYEAGDSLVTIARQLGSSPTTIHRALTARGVPMRPAGGSKS
jgi:AraC-like DNA-binding protein